MPEKQTKKSKRGNTYRTTHLTKEEKMVAETLYKAGIDFSACTPSEAVEWHREVAKKGWAPAQYNLACCYANGKGVERNMKEAAKLFEEAAKQGHPEAQCRLGLCYEYGEIVGVLFTEFRRNSTDACRRMLHVLLRYSGGKLRE